MGTAEACRGGITTVIDQGVMRSKQFPLETVEYLN
jgi:hypothetical protein